MSKKKRQPRGAKVKSHGKSRQRWRKLEGSQAERIIETELLQMLPIGYRSIINPNEGIDIFLVNRHILNVEVKSAKAKTYEKVKGEKKVIERMGRFTLKESDYLTADFFAFVIKEVDPKTLRWTKRYKVKYVRTRDIQEYLKKRGLFGKTQVKLSIKTVMALPDLSVEVLGELIGERLPTEEHHPAWYELIPEHEKAAAMLLGHDWRVSSLTEDEMEAALDIVGL
jgi:hypothetical protein